MPLIRRFAPAVSLRLGHAAALTCPRQVIHYRGAALLPQGEAKGAGMRLFYLVVTNQSVSKFSVQGLAPS